MSKSVMSDSWLKSFNHKLGLNLSGVGWDIDFEDIGI